MVELRITGDSAQDIIKEIATLGEILNPKTTESLTSSVAQEIKPQPATVKAKKKTKKKASKTSKASTPEVSPPTAPAPEQDQPELIGVANHQMVYKAIQELSAAKGLAGARELLKRFDAERISELDASDYAKVIEECRKAVEA